LRWKVTEDILGLERQQPIRLGLKKVSLHLKLLRQMQIFYFPETIFSQFSKQLFSRFPASYFETVFLSWTTSEDPHKNNFYQNGKKAGCRDFRMKLSGLEKNYKG